MPTRTGAGIIEILRRHAGIMKEVPGGRAIIREEALTLRRILQGSAMNNLGSDFMSMSFTYGEEDGPFPYGLQVKRNGCRGIMMCVQAHIIRHLVFKGKSREDIKSQDVLRPGVNLKKEALVSALCEILWRAGGEEKCYVTFPQEGEPTFPQTPDYRYDGATEKLHIYKFDKQNDLNLFLKKNIDMLESGPIGGCYLLICSLVFSRGFEKTIGDLGSSSASLTTASEDCSQGLINLMIIGKAVQGVSNADELYDKSGKLLSRPKLAVNSRGSVGFLFWNKDEDDLSRTEVGSKLKTPKHPIWVTHVNGNFGLLFSLNPDLTRDWREEHKFDLYYHTGLNTQLAEVRLTVDSRFGRKTTHTRQLPGDPSLHPRIPPLEHCILTKWFEAEVDWNGALSFI